MKGQMVFEFIVAGLLFFAIIIYSINYLNVSVADFKGDFYQNVIQSKAVQISDVLMNDVSGLGIVDGNVFNMTKIQNFNSTYCDPSIAGTYQNLSMDLHLWEKTTYGSFPHDVNIVLVDSSDSMLFYCGIGIPRTVQKAELTRFGLLGNEIVRLRVVVW